MITHQTLRIPRGLWADLEETVILQDRQFLSEVARSLGLPVQEVLRKCLGSGAPQSIPVVMEEGGSQCPWWAKSEEGCWRRCRRQRASPTTPCHVHAHAVTSTRLRLDNDPYLADLPTMLPVIYQGSIYWFGPNTAVYREDGSVVSDISFRKMGGSYVLVRC